MIAPRASICVLLLATSIVGLAGGALAAGKIRLAQTSSVTSCMVNCNTTFASCESTCFFPSQEYNTVVQGTFSRGAIAGSGSCISLCTNQQLVCQTTCARTSPSQ
jgi:hypothetical protein